MAASATSVSGGAKYRWQRNAKNGGNEMRNGSAVMASAQ